MKTDTKTWITIVLPDSREFSFPASEQGQNEANQFVGGFCRALECYGIWKDGERHIGCMERNIKSIMQDLRNQIVIQFFSADSASVLA